MDVIKKQILKKDNPKLDAVLYLPILLTQEHDGNGVLTDYSDETQTNKHYESDGNRILITGYCESKIDQIEILGIDFPRIAVGAYNYVGTYTTPYGEEYDGYSGVISYSDTETVYTLNSKLVDGVPDERYGVIYTDKNTSREYYDDAAERNVTITETTYRTYSYGVNKNNFIINDIQYKDERNGSLVTPLVVDSDDISVDRGEKSVLEEHMLLATVKNVSLL